MKVCCHDESHCHFSFRDQEDHGMGKELLMIIVARLSSCQNEEFLRLEYFLMYVIWILTITLKYLSKNS